MYITTIATDPMKLQNLLLSAAFSGSTIRPIMRKHWGGFVDKMFVLKEELQSLPDDEILCFTDAYDVLCLAPEEEILKKFLDFNSGLVLGAELNCFPDHLLRRYGDAPCPTNYKYVNSGGMIGYVKNFKHMLNWKTNAEIMQMCMIHTDQAYVSEYYLAHRDTVVLDVHQRIFQNMHNVAWSEVRFEHGRLRNLVLDETPCFVHFNGVCRRTKTIGDVLHSAIRWLLASRHGIVEMDVSEQYIPPGDYIRPQITP